MQVFQQVAPLALLLVIALLQGWRPLFRGRSGVWRHAAVNAVFWLLGAAVLWPFTVWWVPQAMAAIRDRGWGVGHWGLLPAWLRVVLVFVLFDGWMYVWHRANHTIPLLWRFHRMHHTDPAMDVTTALRFHPGELVLSTLLRFAVFAALGMEMEVLLLYGVVMQPVIFFHHSNFFLPERIDRVLRTIIVTPWMHWVHHSEQREETDSNYGTVFSWWDRLGRSFRLRADPTQIRYGIDTLRDPALTTPWGMLRTPFVG